MRKPIKTSRNLVSPPKITIPEKHYTVALFLATSVIGILIILYGVYSASRDLEVRYKINTLYSLLESQQSQIADSSKAMPDLLNESYYISVLPEGQPNNSFDLDFPVRQEVLESSRVNEQGGFVTLDNKLLVWVGLQHQNDIILLAHQDSYVDNLTLFKVYASYLTVPTFFYVWLMIWATLIIHGLIKKLRFQKEEMEHLALFDGLTDMPNRNLFNDRLDKLILGNKRKTVKFSLAIIDLNDFKKVNDTFGHYYGDALLSIIAGRLKDSVRDSDTVARIGGDEFAMLLIHTENEDMLDMCERIHAKIIQPILFNDKEISVGASIGIASFPEHGLDTDTLLHMADQSMYKIKACGGGALLYQTQDTFDAALSLHSV